PEDVKVSFEFDQTPVVLRSIKNLMYEGGLGAVLTGLMVLVFLRDWRTAFIVVINIPVSLLAALFALWLTGQNVNLMTLGGLALAVGILVDEATVTVENIHTHLARGRPLALAALDATRETALPRLLAMLCILAVFTPALFMTGAARALFTPLALAVGFSMIASFLLSSTLVPILAIWFMRGHEHEIHPSSFFGRLQRGYAATLRGVLAVRWLLLVIYLAAAGLIIWAIGGQLGREIFPPSDAGQFALRLRGPTGTKVENTEALALKVLELIKREAGAENVVLTLGLVGVHAPNYPVNLIHLWNGGPEEGSLAVQLKAGALRVEELKERLRGVFASELPEVRVSFEPSDIVTRVMSFGSNTPVEVAVSGPDIAVNREHAEKIFQKLREIPALRDVQFVQSLDYPTVEVNINREKAGLMGVKVSDVTHSLVAATTSSRFTTANYWADPKSGVSYNLQIQIPQSKTTSLEDLKNVPVNSGNGHPMLLRSFASIAPGTAIGQYERYNMARVISMTANIHGADLGSVARQIERKLAEVGPPPPKTNVAVRGQVVPLNELLGGFRSGLLVAVAVIFLLLAANFESVRLSLIVVSTLPAVIAGVALTLWLTGMTLNIQSGIGAIMALGVAVANAILLVTFAERTRLAGAEAGDAAIDGATSRLRPILMTSFAMSAGMLPMALGFGEGGDQSAPLGRAVIGGLVAATFATLFILPAVFAILRRRSSRVSKSLDATDPESGRFVSPVGDGFASEPAELAVK
ncbi:MAG: efflux RND transporter permease subunit, partial [Verrucomicrobiota bacterium]|nr:efflux RND transporter permease subunit [Verrucomicrobiota bacterium]